MGTGPMASASPSIRRRANCWPARIIAAITARRRVIDVPRREPDSGFVSLVGIVETGELGDEVEIHRTRRTVALLGEDDFRLGLIGLRHLLVTVVVSLAVDEGHYIGVLLDGA